MFVVIDTNVLLVANEQHDDVSPECIASCVRSLREIQNSGITVIDDSFLILTEYQKKTNIKPPKGVGDVFLKWLLRNSSNSKHVDQVRITTTDVDTYSEFPDANLQIQFDPADRKFVAAANAHPKKPAILQAVDSKWLNWIPALKSNGVDVELLCNDEAQRFHSKKFSQANKQNA